LTFGPFQGYFGAMANTLETTASHAWAAVVTALRGKTKVGLRKAHTALDLLEHQVQQLRGHLPQKAPKAPILGGRNTQGELAYIKLGSKAWSIARGAVERDTFEWWCGPNGWESPHSARWQYAKFWNEEYPTLEAARRVAQSHGWE